MKARPLYFLSEDNIMHNGEIFDYIQELHEYLWRFTRAVLGQGTGGNLTDYVDTAIDALEAEKYADPDPSIRRYQLYTEIQILLWELMNSKELI